MARQTKRGDVLMVWFIPYFVVGVVVVGLAARRTDCDVRVRDIPKFIILSASWPLFLVVVSFIRLFDWLDEIGFLDKRIL